MILRGLNVALATMKKGGTALFIVVVAGKNAQCTQRYGNNAIAQ